MGVLGDLAHLATQVSGNTRRYFPVRFVRPIASNIIQAYFTARIKLAAGNAVQVYVGPALFSNDLDTMPLTDAVESMVKNYHKQITGSDAPISVAAGGTLEIDAVNLSSVIRNSGTTPLYSKHFIGVTLLFVNAPVMTGNYDVQKFKIDASANFGGL